ncbi:MAG: endo-1,4-beta-xylanase [Bacteroidales bacterium]|nr:endo-1,4-beta-xylanase [Bacteroidales bacterium]
MLKTFRYGILIFIFLFNFLHVYTQVINNENIDRSIEKYRKGIIHISGKPGASVTVEQLEHEFWFGCALSSGIFSDRSWISEADREIYKEKFIGNFNSAVTENAVKWGSMEENRGRINYTTSDNILEWTEANDIPCRGHNLYWGIDKFVQPWLKIMDNDELLAALEKRGRETAAHFNGRFAEYDLNNEMIHGNYYEDRLGRDITLKMAQWVLEGDPEAKLWLNDYDILTGRRLDDYMEHIRELQSMGVPISGIGVQGHLHGETFAREKLQESLDSLATFGLPVRITEFNIPGQRSKFYRNKSLEITEEEELQKAKELEDYYRICFANPAVEGILMWGFWEGANWIPVSSLYRMDWSPTPALQTYQDLIFEEWNTSVTLQLDEDGNAAVPAFFGKYRITSGDNEMEISLRKLEGSLSIEL